MTGLGKPQLHAKFEVDGFIYLRKYKGVCFQTTNSLFEPLFGGVRGNVRTSFIVRWNARSRLPELFSLAITPKSSLLKGVNQFGAKYQI